MQALKNKEADKSISKRTSLLMRDIPYWFRL